MARPIKETPVLKGSDAVRFLAKINDDSRPKATEAEKDRIRRDYESFKKIQQF